MQKARGPDANGIAHGKLPTNSIRAFLIFCISPIFSPSFGPFTPVPFLPFSKLPSLHLSHPVCPSPVHPVPLSLILKPQAIGSHSASIAPVHRIHALIRIQQRTNPHSSLARAPSIPSVPLADRSSTIASWDTPVTRTPAPDAAPSHLAQLAPFQSVFCCSSTNTSTSGTTGYKQKLRVLGLPPSDNGRRQTAPSSSHYTNIPRLSHSQQPSDNWMLFRQPTKDVLFASGPVTVMINDLYIFRPTRSLLACENLKHRQRYLTRKAAHPPLCYANITDSPRSFAARVLGSQAADPNGSSSCQGRMLHNHEDSSTTGPLGRINNADRSQEEVYSATPNSRQVLVSTHTPLRLSTGLKQQNTDACGHQMDNCGSPGPAVLQRELASLSFLSDNYGP
ncbi:uncharacterized protein CLUP02_02166 [Colletotrichum lupini]|uniref:Uncharacterized protein n=1 Tax=Colletotrichum lupini TaxID=145971 RepID=A0A9Q8SFE4_9PEZI|nr:uncharacterized protein CLUP02_02166 [Colletotrichum lupini]UQC75512.1 hypothetical protein CLUP02_02166 [Colletotrichum lupini]